MKIALFDILAVRNNPAGSCHLRMLEALCQEHEFTVFALQFENPCPERIRFVRIPAPRRPLFLLGAVYRLLAPLIFWLYRLRTGESFDLVQGVESNAPFADLAYAHFCHRGYLDEVWQRVKISGLRRLGMWLTHQLAAWFEPATFKRARWIVAPSEGLKKHLAKTYPQETQGKLQTIPNPVDLQRMLRPADFDRAALRSELGISNAELVFVFVALGNFEGKGLVHIYEAFAQLRAPHLKLVVVGGQPDLIRHYQERAAQLGIAAQIIFTGMQKDVRPFLWSADAFLFPTYYETFSLVASEAAAAGLPLIASGTFGIEDYLVDGVNGWQVNPDSASIIPVLQRILKLAPDELAKIGEAASAAIQPYDIRHFQQAWREFYNKIERER